MVGYLGVAEWAAKCRGRGATESTGSCEDGSSNKERPRNGFPGRLASEADQGGAGGAGDLPGPVPRGSAQVAHGSPEPGLGDRARNHPVDPRGDRGLGGGGLGRVPRHPAPWTRAPPRGAQGAGESRPGRGGGRAGAGADGRCHPGAGRGGGRRVRGRARRLPGRPVQGPGQPLPVPGRRDGMVSGHVAGRRLRPLRGTSRPDVAEAALEERVVRGGRPAGGASRSHGAGRGPRLRRRVADPRPGGGRPPGRDHPPVRARGAGHLQLRAPGGAPHGRGPLGGGPELVPPGDRGPSLRPAGHRGGAAPAAAGDQRAQRQFP